MSEQNNIAVRFKNVCKTYRLYTSSRRRLLGLFFKSVPHKTKHAVVDMNLTVERGEAVAILGRNGAGKSTMLKMITGVTFPTSGEIYVNGIVSALLELTSGFDQEFTGRENIYLKGRILGLNDEDIAKLEPAIIDFAELEEYIDQPVQHVLQRYESAPRLFHLRQHQPGNSHRSMRRCPSVTARSAISAPKR